MTEMSISKVPQLIRFDGRFTSSSVPLEELHIEGCPRFKSFKDEYGNEHLPPQLQKLVISDCEDLERLPDDLSGLSTVEIADCPNLSPSQFNRLGLLESLEELTLLNLKGLMSIGDEIIGTRPSQSLRKLSIRDCRSLVTLPDSLHHLSTLSELSVWGCEELEMDCFPAFPCNLVSFELHSCPKVKSLPQDMHHLTSLKDLRILPCDAIKCFPRGGLPPNLEFLYVAGCRMMNQPLEEWGLASLTSLREFRIEGEMGCLDEMVSFPSSSVDDSDPWRPLLPSSLVRLDIFRMEKLERLSRGLRSHLSSLRVLFISGCLKMMGLPEDGLPDSLDWLRIKSCGLLVERCMEPNGDYWKHLQLIPCVEISP